MWWIFDVVLILFALYVLLRAYRYHRRLKAWSRKSAKEWEAIRGLAKDPVRQDEATRRWMEQTLRKPPKP